MTATARVERLGVSPGLRHSEAALPLPRPGPFVRPSNGRHGALRSDAAAAQHVRPCTNSRAFGDGRARTRMRSGRSSPRTALPGRGPPCEGARQWVWLRRWTRPAVRCGRRLRQAISSVARAPLPTRSESGSERRIALRWTSGAPAPFTIPCAHTAERCEGSHPTVAADPDAELRFLVRRRRERLPGRFLVAAAFHCEERRDRIEVLRRHGASRVVAHSLRHGHGEQGNRTRYEFAAFRR